MLLASDTSISRKMTSPWSSSFSAAARPASTFRAPRKTRKPIRASSRATSKPIPLLAPVTSAVFAFLIGSDSSRRDGSVRCDPFRVPIEVTLVAIDDIARLPQSVVLAGINNQLRRHALAAQGFVHLLAVEQRHVEIGFAAKKERRRFDLVRVKKRIRNAHPRLRVFPRHAELVFVIGNVLIGPVTGEDV